MAASTNAERTENFPNQTFLHLETRLCVLRRLIMRQAASYPKNETSDHVYTVTTEHVDRALYEVFAGSESVIAQMEECGQAAVSKPT